MDPCLVILLLPTLPVLTFGQTIWRVEMKTHDLRPSSHPFVGEGGGKRSDCAILGRPVFFPPSTAEQSSDRSRI